MTPIPPTHSRQAVEPAGGRPCFVFVVCGGESHINELQLALTALRRHSKADILVVTDSRRNQIPIAWSNVRDVTTPAHFDHHQASIHLKTRLHQLVPAGRRYCYLDSDVFATGPEVDEIFSYVTTPVAFAADHCRLHEFSPHAVRCGCAEVNAAERAALDSILTKAYEAGLGVRGGWWPADYEMNASNQTARLRSYLEHLLSPTLSSQRGDPNHFLWAAYWYESRSHFLYQPRGVVRFVERSTGWRRYRRRQSWISPAGNDVFHPQCNHLVAAIHDTFGITVARPRWQHWNGGVFLFDDRGHAFLDAWHEKTMRIFGLPGWRVRDQGTLVATAWEFGLHDQPLLPSRFNCILDAHRGDTMVSSTGDAVTTDAFLTRIQPALAHVMWRTGDQTWDVWRWVEKCARFAETSS